MTSSPITDLAQALMASAKQFDARPAISAGELRLTYRQLMTRAFSIAKALIDAEIAAGECVAILGGRTVTPYVAILGSLLAGCCYVPLNPKFPSERNRLILEMSGARVLIVDDVCGDEQGRALGSLEELLVITPESSHLACAGAGRRLAPETLPEIEFDGFLPRLPPQPGTPAYLLFTSGTTGQPKGVPISHANLASYLAAIHPLVPVGPDDRVLQVVDLTFDLSVHDMMLTWLNGAELYVAPENGAILAPRIIATHGITACLIVPSAGARAIDYGLAPPGRMPSLRYSLFAGEALPLPVAERWQAAAPNAALFNLYGPTEGTIHTSYYRFDPACLPPAKAVPIGWPLGAQQMCLCDAAGLPVGEGESGEIFLSGPQMTAGYWRAPQLDQERFVERDGVRWYRTGDLGRLIPGHGILFSGRADRQLKIRGYRVELQEVEGTLREVSGSNQVAILGWPEVADGAADGLMAVVAGLEVEPDVIQVAMRQSLPSYMVPGQVIGVEKLPLNANGKTDYQALWRLLTSAGEAG